MESSNYKIMHTAINPGKMTEDIFRVSQNQFQFCIIKCLERPEIKTSFG